MSSPVNIPQPPSYQALYRACMKEAAAQGRTLMQRLIVRARNSMTQAATIASTPAERTLLTDAARTMMKHEGALCDAYPQALLGEFAQAISGSARKSLSFDSLELMDDDQVFEGVELIRTQNSVQDAVNIELTELNALMCAVQGMKTAQAEGNPLRPEVYVRSLQTVAMESPVSNRIRSRWMQHLGAGMGPELARVYFELAELLRKQGVSPVGLNVMPARAPIGSPLPDAEPTAPPDEASQARTLLNMHELRRLLAGEFDAPAEGTPSRPGDFSNTMPDAFEALQEMKQVDKVVQRLQQRKSEGPADGEEPGADLREQLLKDSAGVGRALGLEVVSLMVDNIASDARLLAPVQEAVRDLEPALMRLVITDPRFFSDKKHPARQLLEQMTQRSLAWQSVDVPGFAEFLEPLQEAVEALVITRVQGVEPFDFALQTLEDAWGEQQKRDRRYREKAVRTLLQAEQRNLLASKISNEMRARGDVSVAPREALSFIVGPWTHVLAQARISDQGGTADPDGYLAMIDDLLSSVQPRLGAGNASRLARLVPPLLATLKKGLASIDYPADQTQRFLDQLADLHMLAMKPPEAVRRPSLATSMTREQLEAQFADDGGTWLGPKEARFSGFMDTDQHGVAQPLFTHTEPGGSGALTVDGSGEADNLPKFDIQVGAWVELYVDGGWARYQLTWSSPHGTLFMFTSTGGKTQSMTRRSLDKMYQAGTLRMFSQQAVVEGALDAVAKQAAWNTRDRDVDDLNV